MFVAILECSALSILRQLSTLSRLKLSESRKTDFQHNHDHHKIQNTENPDESGLIWRHPGVICFQSPMKTHVDPKF